MMLMREPGPPASSMARRSGTAICPPNSAPPSKRRYPGMLFCFLNSVQGQHCLRLCWWVFRVRRLNLLVLWLSLLRSLLVVLSLFTGLVSRRRFAWLIPLLVRCIGLLGLLVRLIAFPRLGNARGTPNKVIDDCAYEVSEDDGNDPTNLLIVPQCFVGCTIDEHPYPEDASQDAKEYGSKYERDYKKFHSMHWHCSIRPFAISSLRSLPGGVGSFTC